MTYGELIGNAFHAADVGMNRAKLAKKKILQEHAACGHDATLYSQFIVVRDGMPEVVFTVDDNNLWPGFTVAARFFSAHIIMMLVDDTRNGLSKLAVCGVDRKQNVEWREASYDYSAYGLSWSAVQRVDRPPDVHPEANATMIETMAEETAEEVVNMLNAIRRRRPDFSIARVRALCDLSTIEWLRTHNVSPFRSVRLIATRESQRLETLLEYDLPVVVE